jgi:hypothetical protein
LDDPVDPSIPLWRQSGLLSKQRGGQPREPLAAGQKKPFQNVTRTTSDQARGIQPPHGNQQEVLVITASLALTDPVAVPKLVVRMNQMRIEPNTASSQLQK